MYKLNKDQISDYKELFLLFDKDENGVLTFAELGTAMRTLGQRLPGRVSEILLQFCNLFIIFVPPHSWIQAEFISYESGYKIKYYK